MKTRAERIVSFERGRQILDVGCAGHVPRPGSPYWIHGLLRANFPVVFGIDIHEANIEAIRELGHENLIIANAESFDIPKEFDTMSLMN